MLRLVVFVGIALSFLALFLDEAGAQKKDAKGPKEPAETTASADDYKMLLNMKEIYGKLVSNGQSGTLGLDVDFPRLEPNPNYKPGMMTANIQQLQSLYQQQQQALKISNAGKKQQQLIKIAQQVRQVQLKIAQQQAKEANPFGPNGPFKVINDTKSFELDMSDKLEVRKWSIEGEYDEKGNIKKYTKEELAALRGNDPKKPGFKAKLDDLQNGQIVNLYLGPPKTSSKDAKPKDEPAKDQKPSDSKSTQTANVQRPTVTMVLILQDSTGIGGDPGKKRK